MQLQEDDCRLRKGHALVIMDILSRSTLNMVHPLQQNCKADVSIGLLCY